MVSAYGKFNQVDEGNQCSIEHPTQNLGTALFFESVHFIMILYFSISLLDPLIAQFAPSVPILDLLTFRFFP